MCFRANKQDDFWPVFDKAHGASSTSAAGATLPVALRATVHAVANQLPRVTSTWRTRAVEGLRTVAGLEDLAEEQLQSALHEVVQLSTAVGPPPPLPPGGASSPTTCMLAMLAVLEC